MQAHRQDRGPRRKRRRSDRRSRPASARRCRPSRQASGQPASGRPSQPASGRWCRPASGRWCRSALGRRRLPASARPASGRPSRPASGRPLFRPCRPSHPPLVRPCRRSQPVDRRSRPPGRYPATVRRRQSSTRSKQPVTDDVVPCISSCDPLRPGKSIREVQCLQIFHTTVGGKSTPSGGEISYVGARPMSTAGSAAARLRSSRCVAEQGCVAGSCADRRRSRSPCLDGRHAVAP